MMGPDAASCKAALADACRADAPWQSVPLMFGLHPGNDTVPLPFVEQDIAAFLLMRGDYAWLGYGVWGMSWPAGITFDSNGTAVPRPPQMDADYGSPTSGVCAEVSAGVFARAFTRVNVTLDCNTWASTYTWL
jgi:hypothetical protein